MKLSEQQIKLIREQVAKNDLSMETLKDDLIDHLCCVTESKVTEGKEFNTSLREAFFELAPEGLREIERETYALLINQKYIPMKKVMFLTGCICSMLISLGWLMKFLNNPPLGNMLFGLGSFGFMILFLPMLAFAHFRISGKPFLDKIRFVFGVSSIVVIGIAILSLLMRLPGANEVMIVGLVIFTFGFVPVLYLTLYKKSVANP